MTNQVATTTNNEEKIWEKPWSYNEMKAQSTTWSLAGDSGVILILKLILKIFNFYLNNFFQLLLNLKQFSENLISKSVEIEKKLQQLNHSEKVKTKFLIQFTKNLYYKI